MDRKFTPTTLLILAALLIWTADFLAIYVFGAVVCARGLNDVQVLGLSLIPFFSLVATLASLGAIIAIMLGVRRRANAQNESQAFVQFLTLALSVLALAAVVWTAMPGLLLQAQCA